MATVSRVSLGGWIQYDDSVALSRVTIGGWMQDNALRSAAANLARVLRLSVPVLVERQRASVRINNQT